MKSACAYPTPVPVRDVRRWRRGDRACSAGPRSWQAAGPSGSPRLVIGLRTRGAPTRVTAALAIGVVVQLEVEVRAGDGTETAVHRQHLAAMARVRTSTAWMTFRTLGDSCVLRAACCVLRAACCVLRAACCGGQGARRAGTRPHRPLPRRPDRPSRPAPTPRPGPVVAHGLLPGSPPEADPGRSPRDATMAGRR